MENKVVNFKVAKLAKEKGFSNGTSRRLTHYKEESNHPEDGTKGPFGWEKNKIQIDDGFIVNGRRDLGDLSNEFFNCCELPTQGLLQRWLREKYFIVIDLNSIHKNYKDKISYTWNIIQYDDKLSGKEGSLKKIHNMRGSPEMSYEEALEKALQKALKLI